MFCGGRFFGLTARNAQLKHAQFKIVVMMQNLTNHLIYMTVISVGLLLVIFLLAARNALYIYLRPFFSTTNSVKHRLECQTDMEEYQGNSL